ncbi:MAG: peptide ABC transporter permease [Firmicutes bacterium HGW-Firmicutes-1]|jgi:oligopeptide transport system permease protein|nr:MAG: peptide ABC transporter permease [Firmicutes bacterium HGW-Firmicutes-1]
MLKYIGKRLLISIVTMLVILSLLFLLLEFMPGSPFNDEKLNEQQKELLYEKYGLNKPMAERFVIYTKNIFKGDFGVSYTIEKNAPVSRMLKSRMPISMRLGLQALIFGSLIGVVLASIAAVYKNSKWDTMTTVFAVIGISIPSYVFALGLSYFLGYKLTLAGFPIFPMTYNIYKPIQSSILPTISLSMFVIATVARFMRTELVEVLGSDYIMLAEAKGLTPKKVIFRHSIRNALIPVVTVLGPLTVGLMTGSLVIERIFGIPGIGDLLVTAISVNDFNVVIAISFFYSLFYIIMALFIDVIYGVIDPRIRVAKGGE